MLVKFVRAYEAYAAGEVAKFDKDAAKKLIDCSYAEEYKAPAK